MTGNRFCSINFACSIGRFRYRSLSKLLLAAAISCCGGICAQAQAADRTIEGIGNNVANPNWGAASDPGAGLHVQLLRVGSSDYGDGISTPSGASRPSAREISNTVAAQVGSLLNDRALTDFVWQWGQFVDHDIDLTEGASPAEPFNILVPTGDPDFDPGNTGTQVIPLSRSTYDPATGFGGGNPREQTNGITSYIDASNIYGSDATRASTLRTGVDGRLATSAGNLLPFNTGLLPNANGGPVADNLLYLSGDVRANEQIALTAMHTLFMREHNRLAGEIKTANPGFTDEQIYQRARKVVGAQMQVITYEEFLPALMGPDAPSGTSPGYDSLLDAGITNEFSTAIYRLGHSMLSSDLARVQNDGTTAPGGNLPLLNAFFDPSNLTSPADLEYLLKGLASQEMQELDNLIIDDVRNFLFGPPGSGGFDLAALNIQRGRDHGLPDYNTMRTLYGLSSVTLFSEITSDPTLQTALQTLYGNVNDIDPWVGALAEDHLTDSSIGDLITAVMVDQFERLRDGDRFWYENDSMFTPLEIAELKATRLSDIIRRNTNITNLNDNVFVIPEPGSLTLFGFGAALVLVGVLRRRLRG